MTPSRQFLSTMVLAAMDEELHLSGVQPKKPAFVDEAPETTAANAGVLVVDDRPEKRLAAQAVLAELGLPVILADSGVDALRHLLREDFSVILIDLNMPHMDGIELATLIRSRGRTARTPIIFYTADAESALKRTEEAYALGAIDLLVAPVPAQVLRAKVAVYADFHRRLVDVQRMAGERERLLQAEAARAEAERASAAKDHFLAMLSHELRTPLSPVLNTIESLLDSPEHPVALREELEMIRRNVALEARLIDDLLDLTRVSRGKVQLLVEQVDVHECIQSVLRICAPEMQDKNVTAQFQAKAKNRMVHADAARMKQILWNLIRNAVKYTDPGSIISVSTHDAEDGRLCIQVTDDGCGIAPELLPGIFDAFRQGAHTTGGLGLGLAITRSLVEVHGGSIEASSEGRGCGATFTVLLPSFAPPLKAEAPAPASPPVTAPARIGAKLLLVEDHPDSRLTLERLLRRRGYTVESAEDLRTAVALAQTSRYDVIISDIGLPDGSGHDLMRQIPKEHGGRAISLSGFGMDDDIARSATSGFSRHLIKPVNFAELDSVIQSLLSNSCVA